MKKPQIHAWHQKHAQMIDFLGWDMPIQFKSITQEHREKLFERGFSSKKGRKGLGMYIVKRIIEAHNFSNNLV